MIFLGSALGGVVAGLHFGVAGVCAVFGAVFFFIGLAAWQVALAFEARDS